TPDRLVALDLDPAHTRIVGARVLVRDTARVREPTHLVALGDTVFFVANGGFDAYGPDGALLAGVVQHAPVIARVTLAPRVLHVGGASDTARTKAELLAADRALARAAARRGSATVIDALADDAAVLVPYQPILRGAREAATPLRARYDA